MSFAAPSDESGVRERSKQLQPKQGRDEGSAYERNIKASIQEMQESMRAAQDQLERAKRGFLSKRTGESLEKFLERSRECAQETERLFRDWTVALADEPSERRRKKFSYEKLQKAFEQEMAQLKELAQAAKAQQEDSALDVGARPRVVECHSMCDDQEADVDEEQGLLDDSDLARAYMEDTQTQDLSIQNNIAHEREDGIRRIQSQVAEVNQIFRDLASIVSEQGKQFESIEESAEMSVQNTKDAGKELKKAMERQRSQRERMCCMLITAVLILCVIVLPHTHVGTPGLHRQLQNGQIDTGHLDKPV